MWLYSAGQVKIIQTKPPTKWNMTRNSTITTQSGALKNSMHIHGFFLLLDLTNL